MTSGNTYIEDYMFVVSASSDSVTVTGAEATQIAEICSPATDDGTTVTLGFGLLGGSVGPWPDG